MYTAITKHRVTAVAALFCCSCILLTGSEDLSDYKKIRQSFLDGESALVLGGTLLLTNDEEKVNALLMSWKELEINTGLQSNSFPPAMHFFKAKSLIEKSDVMKLIQHLPKGGALHLHDSSMVPIDWVIKNVTYRDYCYICYDTGKDQAYFRFSLLTPVIRAGNCSWILLSDYRQKHGADVVDKWLEQQMTLLTDDPYRSYPNQDVVWAKFVAKFTAIGGLYYYVPVYQDYYRQALEQFYQDNVQYIEVRGLWPDAMAYDLQGNVYNRTWFISTNQRIAKEFVQAHKDFIGAKSILSSTRSSLATNISKDVAAAVYLRQTFPEHFVGYDLVGQEDAGYSLMHFLPELLSPSQNNLSLPYFFHAGETDIEGLSVDDNLIDAVLLNTTRIGHGFALLKHPNVQEIIRIRPIPIEVNPISNQVLMLVADLRNHPAAAMFAQSFPICVSADDPTMWGARGLSYDFYEAFMGMSPAASDLRFLKQLAINSLEFSALDSKEKSLAFQKWQFRWQMFIKETVKHFRL